MGRRRPCKKQRPAGRGRAQGTIFFLTCDGISAADPTVRNHRILSASERRADQAQAQKSDHSGNSANARSTPDRHPIVFTFLVRSTPGAVVINARIILRVVRLIIHGIIARPAVAGPAVTRLALVRVNAAPAVGHYDHRV